MDCSGMSRDRRHPSEDTQRGPVTWAVQHGPNSQDFTKNWVDDHTFTELRDPGGGAGSVENMGSDQDTLSVKYLWTNQMGVFFFFF